MSNEDGLSLRPDGQLYLILHRVRGEPAFDIAMRLDIGSAGGWIVPTSGHRAYPYRWWPLEDLADISDINNSGFHERPSALDHTVPADWPDHYRVEAAPRPVRAKVPGVDGFLTEAELEAITDIMQDWRPSK